MNRDMNIKIGHILKVFELFRTVKITNDNFKIEYDVLSSMCNDSTLLVREKFTLNAILNYSYEKFFDQLHLGYIYGGVIYSTAKNARKEGSLIPSTEILISFKLDSKEWDRMGQVWLYNDNTVFQHLKDEVLTKGADGILH